MRYKLQSLRGISALVIVIGHTPFLLIKEEIANTDLAVDFFFILSGFVMTFAYQQKIVDGFSIKKYFLLRLGRLYPLHIITLILWGGGYEVFKIIMGIGSQFPEENNLRSFISNIFLVHSFGIHDSLNWNFPSWSISSEFYTYILFYILLISLDRKRKVIVPFIISIIGYSVLLNNNSTTIALTFDSGFIRCVAGFYLGVAVFRLSNRYSMKINKQIGYYEITSFLLLFLLIIFLPKDIAYFDLLYCIAFAFMVCVFSQEGNGFLGKILNQKKLIDIGVYSYSIYLLHIFVILFFENIFISVFHVLPESIKGFYSLILNTLICIITIIISKYSYKFVEGYFRKQSKKIVTRLND